MAPSRFKLPASLVVLLSVTAATSVVPHFADLKIKTRRSEQGAMAVETLYLKGARQRQEYLRDKPVKTAFTSISLCDERTRIDLNDDAKLYAQLPIVDWSEQQKRTRPIPQSEMTGADVTITTDTIDTGERRQQGAYTARHVQTRITVESGAGAAMPSSVEERDAWYIDLPGLGCEESSQRTGLVYAMIRPGNRHDRMHFKQLGTAHTGFPLEETVSTTEQGKITVSKLELLEFSEAPLDDALFKTPAGYSPALSTPHGGYDMTKPETLANRVQVRWAELKDWTKQWF